MGTAEEGRLGCSQLGSPELWLPERDSPGTVDKPRRFCCEVGATLLSLASLCGPGDVETQQMGDSSVPGRLDVDRRGGLSEGLSEGG